MNRVVWALLIILVIYGLALRIYDLEGQSLWNDEAVSMGAAHDLIDNGFDSDLFRHPGQYPSMSLLNASILAGSIFVFGDTVFALRFPAVVFGTLMIPLVFYFTRRLTKDEIVALVATALITFLMVEVSWARSARMYQGFQFFFLLSLCLLWIGHQSHRPHLLVPLGVAVVLTVFMHRLGLLLLPVFVLYFLGAEYERIKHNLRLFAVMALGVGSVAVLSYVVLDLSVDIGDRIGVTSWMEYYRDSLLLSLNVLVVLALVGICFMVTRIRRAAVLLFIAFWFPLYVLSVHYTHGSGDRFLYAMVPVLVITAAYAVVLVPRRLASGRPLRVMAFVVIVGLILLVGDIALVPRTSYHGFDRSLHVSNMKSAYEFVNENQGQDDVVVNMWGGLEEMYLDQDPEYYLAGTGFMRSNSTYLFKGELEELVQTGTGWVVVDMGGSYMRGIDPVLATLDLVYTADNGTPDYAWVYHW